MDNKFKFFTSMVFNKKVIKTIFRKQKFVIPEPVNGVYIGTTQQFNISDNYLKEWNDLLKSDDATNLIPYTYYWPWLMDWLMKNLLPDLGISLKNVLHMGHDATFSENFSKIKNGNYIIKNYLKDLCPLSKNKIDMVTETVIESEEGEIIFHVRDHTIILNMKDEDMEMLQHSEIWDTVDVPFKDDSFRRKDSVFKDSTDCRISKFECKGDIASKFGSVSGALSITHASVIPAKIFRQGKIFLQGMCTGNIVMKVLAHEFNEDIKNFEVYFTNQLAFPQVVEIRFNDSRFEAFDESNTMVAYGTRKLQNSNEETMVDELNQVA